MSTEAPASVPFVREVYPYLCVRGAAAAIEFYSRVFGAQEIARLAEPDGRIAHAELKLGSTTMMLADERPEAGIQSPLAFGGTGTTLHLHVEDVDTRAPGDRSGSDTAPRTRRSRSW